MNFDDIGWYALAQLSAENPVKTKKLGMPYYRVEVFDGRHPLRQ
jgi:hypothetical protein